jgi:hypothetical protein
MTGDPDIEPAMELGGQIKQFDSHNAVLFKVRIRDYSTTNPVTLRIWHQS